MKTLNLVVLLILMSNLFFNLQAQQTKPVFRPVDNSYEGRKELYKFISKNIVYPKEAQEKGIKGSVIVNVIIEEDGRLSNVDLGGYKHDFGFGEEAIRVINMVPKWIPIQIDGKNVRTKYLLFVKFPPDTSIYEESTDNKPNTDTLHGRFYSINLMKYYYPKDFSGYDFYLFLYADGNYCIKLEKNSEFDVILLRPIISSGKYEVENNLIVLTDSYTQCKMLFQLENSNLKPVNTFPFIKDLAFKDYYVCGSVEKEDWMNETTVKKLVGDFEKKNPFTEHLTKDELIKLNPFTDGLYRYEFYRGERFEIKLDKNNKYEFSFKVFEESFISSKLDLFLIISTGTWNREGNILKLWDTNLKHHFYGLIHKDGSVELLFFQWVEKMIFIKR